MRTLPRNYSLLELDRGDDMLFHPCTGRPRPQEGLVPEFRFCFLSFDEPPRRHYTVAVATYKQWSFYGCYCSYQGGSSKEWRRIGDGRDRQKGDPFLDHWQYDPFTGEKLFDYMELEMQVAIAMKVITDYLPHYEHSNFKLDLKRALYLAHHTISFDEYFK